MSTLFYGTSGYELAEKTPPAHRECGYGVGPTRASRRAAERARAQRPAAPVVDMTRPRVEAEMPTLGHGGK